MKSITKNKSKGITLIALVVTIIVLLILAGITITMVAGEDGVIKQAKITKEKTEGSVKHKEDELNKLINQLDGILGEKDLGGNTNTPGTNPGGDTDPNTPGPNPGGDTDPDTPYLPVVAITGEETKDFDDLKSAMGLASQYENLSVYITEDYTLNEDITIPTNVTVIVGNGKTDSYAPANVVNTYGNLTINSTVTVEGKLYVCPWVNNTDGIARNISDIQTRKIILGSSGSIETAQSGQYTDYSKVSGALLQVKDYVDYPATYSNVSTTNPLDSSQSVTSNFNGWRVVMNGKDEQGNRVVEIATAGIPKTITISEEDFNENNLGERQTATLMGMDFTGNELKNLLECGKDYYLEQYATSYSVLGIAESLFIYANGGCDNDLVLNGGYYFVNGYNKEYGIGYVTPSSWQDTLSTHVTSGTSGIRPVVTLKNDLSIYKLYDDKNERYCWQFAEI